MLLGGKEEKARLVAAFIVVDNVVVDNVVVDVVVVVVVVVINFVWYEMIVVGGVGGVFKVVTPRLRF